MYALDVFESGAAGLEGGPCGDDVVDDEDMFSDEVLRIEDAEDAVHVVETLFAIHAGL